MKFTKKIKYLSLFMSLMLFVSIFSIFNDFNVKTYADANPETTTTVTPKIIYQAHSQKVGWQDAVSNGTMAGTTGLGLRLEALNIKLDGIDGGITYRGYVEGSGWQPYVADGVDTGKTGTRKSLMAVQISLTGEAAKQYDLYYQIHKSNVGWMGWVTAGKQAGISCIANKMEAIQIMLVPKGSAAPKNLPTTSSNIPVALYSAHVVNIGWQDFTSNAGVAGTTGNAQRLEAAKIRLSSSSDDFNIEYSMFVQNTGWQDYTTANTIAGTTGSRLETYGLKVRLTGYLSAPYSVYYRTYISGIGWSQWACDGAVSGYVSSSKMIEAFQVRVTPKGQKPSNSLPITSTTPLTLNYETHVQSIGWQNTFTNGDIAGTVGKAKRVEAFSMSFADISTKELGIRYKSHVQSIGWQNWSYNGGVSGTVGQAKRVEAIKIELTGTKAEQFDIYYRVHSQNVGWLDWACNGRVAGSTGLSYRIEAMQVIIVPKGAAAPGKTNNPFVGVPYTFIDVSHHQNNKQFEKYGTYNLNWNAVSSFGIKHAMVRVQYGLIKDKYYKENITGALNSGMQVGVYCYSIATTVAEAQAEARAIVSAIKNYRIELPIAYDLEDANIQGFRSSLTNAQRTDLILAFKKVIEDSGYAFILYSNTNWLQNYIDTSRLGKTEIWMARYNVDSYNEVVTDANGKERYPIIKSLNIKMWQYTSTGIVPGIAGNVDMNQGYKIY